MKSRKIWKTVLIALGCALGAWAFGALLLPVLLPFFIGLAVVMPVLAHATWHIYRKVVERPAGGRPVASSA